MSERCDKQYAEEDQQTEKLRVREGADRHVHHALADKFDEVAKDRVHAEIERGQLPAAFPAQQQRQHHGEEQKGGGALHELRRQAAVIEMRAEGVVHLDPAAAGVPDQPAVFHLRGAVAAHAKETVAERKGGRPDIQSEPPPLRHETRQQQREHPEKAENAAVKHGAGVLDQPDQAARLADAALIDRFRADGERLHHHDRAAETEQHDPEHPRQLPPSEAEAQTQQRTAEQAGEDADHGKALVGEKRLTVETDHIVHGGLLSAG